MKPWWIVTWGDALSLVVVFGTASLFFDYGFAWWSGFVIVASMMATKYVCWRIRR